MNDEKPFGLVQLGTKDELAALIERIKRDMDKQVELASLIAKIRATNYRAYIAEGFTPQQALELCQK